LIRDEYYAHAIGPAHRAAFGRLVEQVEAHGRGELLLQARVDGVAWLDVKFALQEALILRRHVLLCPFRD